MTYAPYLAAYWTGDRYAGALNANPIFAWWDGAPPDWIPAGWSVVGETPVIAVAGLVSNLAARLSADAGLEGALAAGALSPGWFVLQAVVTLQSGALIGAGAQLACFADADYATLTETCVLSLAADPDETGLVNGVGVAGTTYRYRKLIQLADPATYTGVLSAYAQGPGGGVITDGSGAAITDGLGADITDGGPGGGGGVLDFNLCLVRPADPAEIAAGNPVQGLAVFPLTPGLSVTVKKTPSWGTVIKRAASGRERRTERWPYPLWSFELSHEVLRRRPGDDELSALWELFNIAEGQVSPWLFLDASDYAVQGAPLGIGDGATTQFQLMRTWDSFAEPVLAPFGASMFDSGAPAIGVTLQPGGVAVFASPPAAGHVLTWSGYFFHLCRFAQDDLSFDQLVAQLWSGKGLKFTSFRS